MAHTNKHGKHSTSLHTPRFRTTYIFTPAKKIILTVIALTIIVVIIAIVYPLFFNDECLVKSQISTLATDYYENYFYPNYTSSTSYAQISDLDTAMAKYETYGFAPITLRQLLLYDDQKNTSHAAYLTEHCDENATLIRFYPEAPYSQTSYRTEYTYSCNF